MQDQIYPGSPPRLPLTPLPQDAPRPTDPVQVYGLGLNAAQLRRQLRRRGPTRWLEVAILLLLGLLCYMGLAYAVFFLDDAASGAMAAMIALAATLIGIGMLRRHFGERRAFVSRWRLYAAETEGGLTTVVYPDRVEQFSARWRVTVPLDDRTLYTEDADVLCVERDGQCAFLRAEDLAPWEAQAIYERISAAVPPCRQLAAGRFMAGRDNSAPPPFVTEPPALYERFSYLPAREPMFRGLPVGLIPCLLAVCIIGAVFFTILYRFVFSVGLLADFLIFLCLFFAVSAGITLLVLWLRDRAAARREGGQDPTVTLAFTAAGLQVTCRGRQAFVAARDVQSFRTENGVTMDTPAGRFTFPWSAVQNRQQLEWMLLGQRSAF